MTWELVNDNNLDFLVNYPFKENYEYKTNGAYNGDNEVLYLSLMQHTGTSHNILHF